jgi:hypothetical protein
VGTEIEDEPVLFPGDRAAAERRRFFEEHHRQAGPGDERGGEKPRQSAADDYDWRLRLRLTTDDCLI